MKNKTTKPAPGRTSHLIPDSDVKAAVRAVVGNEPDTFAGIDPHPSSLDLPQKDYQKSSRSRVRPKQRAQR